MVLHNGEKFTTKNKLFSIFILLKETVWWGIAEKSSPQKIIVIILHFYLIIGDSLKYHNGHKFSTKDNDNDSKDVHCAILNKGGWWYNKCHSANLNGLYLNGTYAKYAFGMTWFYWKKHQYSFMETKMMMRRN